MPHGTLEVNCVAGRQLRDVEMFGKQDPYLKLALETQTQKTRAHASGGRNPTWNTTLSFNIFEGARSMRVEAWDEDATSDDLIGMTTIDLSRAFATGVDDQWFPLFTKSGKPAGEVHLVIYFRAAYAPFNQGGNPQFNQGGNPQFLQQSSSPVQSSYKPVKDHSTLETVAMVGAGVAGAAALGFLGKQALDAYKKKDHKDGAHPSAPAAGKH
ncbi:hypothetical protein AMAG_03533 [Allomyces macrogynus ATCC 38327]|uniref:C2 domain-containing protein n=1 Tax=Allomyces macrogynus (strain ATCC 38327) TaxID=578462 RepID=A0A0L0S9Z7_ALLM3|nr:hypothetical protein AMAG_03533 [Allomyces macrogynus ATCC 38327]|eukprot:KNE59214.1 hypothetical protein AMAG_03533 [Allomyces macrogynus ATCC 38327]